jgi:membrane-associated protein
MVDEYQLLSAISSWGLPVLLVIFLGSGIGVPLPATFLLMAAGSLVAQDELGFWEVTVLATIGVVVGDQIGYMLGRWGGDRVTDRFGGWVDRGGHLRQAESIMERWGGMSVFLSRWLLTPLGWSVNLVSGLTKYPWHYFVVFDVAGEAVWVVGNVLLGCTFSDRVLQVMGDVMDSLPWAIVGLIGVTLGWKLLRPYLRPSPVTRGSPRYHGRLVTHRRAAAR